MKDRKGEKILQDLFEEQRKAEQMGVPAFLSIYKGAKQQAQYKNQRKYALLGLFVLLSLALAFLFRPKQSSQQAKEMPLLQASINYYKQLLENGKIVTSDIHFEYDKANIKPESMTIIQAIARMMKAHPELKLHIEGHTDNLGSATYNQALSEVRAEAVKKSLLSLQIAENRLTYQGFGEAKPTVSNDTESGRRKNRRVEFVLR